MNAETVLQNKIRVALSDIAVTFRINVGTFKAGDRFISTGVPKGYTDLSGVRRKDGRAVFIEVKNEKGKLSKDQENFIKQMKRAGAIAGVARSPEEAIKIVMEG